MEEFNNGDVVSMKLSSGEEIIGRYETEDENHVYLSKPLSILPSHNGIGMAQCLLSMDLNQMKPVGFKKTAIIIQVHTKQDLATHYVSNTSQIQVIPKGVLLG
jgi:hypothetical protein